MSDAATWTKRIEAWRASGLRAAVFCRDEEYAASTLQWWASKLKRDARGPAGVRIARVVQARSADTRQASRRSPIVVEASPSGARVMVDVSVDREALRIVFELLGIGGRG